ncbi:hypothetical protein OH491_19590 [Termitidicoccus mucosus]|uniref:Uncharacterized protein n=1 Tax=Termitidicoccus mucosus TaxID=1184151 RepID=A0A178IIC7_9BACT|nr:hypothetical protein AW736_09090 [Opitutaceae bacterium TSB47]
MSLADHLEKQRRAQAGYGSSTQAGRETNDTPADFFPMTSPSSPHPDKPTEPGVLLRQWNRKTWVFPWSYFIEAEYFPSNTGSETQTTHASPGFTEQVRLVFGPREITLRGRNLAVLMDSIARHRVVELREVPEKFLPADTHDAAESVIVSMEIRLRAK